jgi:hypothetical protein
MSSTPTVFLTTSTTIPTFASFAFQVNGLANSAEYLGLFDQYRIDWVEVWIEPDVAQGSTVFGPFATAVDLDDVNVPSTYVQVASKQGSLNGNGGSGRYHSFQPHMAVAVYSGTFTSFANSPPEWIDSGSPAVQHYGIKTAALATPSGTIAYLATVRARVSFRAPGV